MKDTNTFRSKQLNEIYQIKKKINFNPKLVVYLIELGCVPSNAMIVSWPSFLQDLITIKARITIFERNKTYQIMCGTRNFHKHYLQSDYNRICNWEIRIIYNAAETEKSWRQKELYWHHKLKIYVSFSLNKCDFYAAY